MNEMEQELINDGYERLMPEIEELRLYRKDFGDVGVEMNGNCGEGNDEWRCHIDDDHAMTLGNLMVTDYSEVQRFITFIRNILKIRQLKAKKK